MARPVVLVIDSHPERLRERQDLVRRAGYVPLPAPTLRRAQELLHKVRPSLILSAAHLDDGHSATLLHLLREEALTEHLPLAVLGPLTAQEQRALADDPHVHLRAGGDEAVLLALLTEVLGRPEPEHG